MKFLTITSGLFLCSLVTTYAQNAQKDIIIYGSYHINKIMPLGKAKIYVNLKNNSKSDYKDITYRVKFIAGDGTEEGGTNLTLHDFIGPGVSKKMKDQYVDCPRDCNAISFSIVSGKKLD